MIHGLRVLLAAICFLSFSTVAPAIAAAPPAVNVVGSVALLKANITAVQAAYMSSVTVTSYYGTLNNCPISYVWNASDSRTDDGGAIINPTGNGGNGRWNLNLPPNSPVHSCMYGIKIDSPVTDLTPTTDNSTQLQRMLNWAYTYGPNAVFFDAKKGFCIGYSTTLAPNEGEVLQGGGTQQYGGLNPSNSCLLFPYTTVGYAIALQTPYPGHGTTPFESPKFRDFTVNMRGATTAAGGCIQLNSIAGGFTDDTASQQPVIHPEVSGVVCNMGSNANNLQIGFQCSKCADGAVTRFDSYFGYQGVDLEGSENIDIYNGRITDTVGPMVLFTSHGTFGNNDSLHNYQLLNFANFGQSVDSWVLDGARSSEVYNNFLENSALPDADITAALHASGGFIHSYHDNKITIGATIPWINLETNYNNLTAFNNGGYGAVIHAGLFPAGNYFYTTGVRQILTHYGNGVNGDNGWPSNSIPDAIRDTGYNALAVWTPSTDGLLATGIGATEVPALNRFTFSGTTGSGNFLSWTNPSNGPLITGSRSAQIFAAGTGTLTCQPTDGGSLVGSPQTFSMTTSQQIFSETATSASTYYGLQCFAASGAPLITQIVVY